MAVAPSVHYFGPMGSGRKQRIERAGWNPWVALRELEQVETSDVALPEGVTGASVPYPGRPVVLLDDGPTLGRTQRLFSRTS
jgi:hypothetical protein